MVNKFNTSIQGYNKEEVNGFVKEVTNEYESMLLKLKNSYKLIENQKQELEHYKALESSLNRAILIAEESMINVKKASYDEAKVVVEDAKARATKILNNALAKADSVEADAEALRRKVTIYKKKFRDLVEEHLDEIDKFPDRL